MVGVVLRQLSPTYIGVNIEKEKPGKIKVLSVEYTSDFVIFGHKLFSCCQN